MKELTGRREQALGSLWHRKRVLRMVENKCLMRKEGEILFTAGTVSPVAPQRNGQFRRSLVRRKLFFVAVK